VILSEKTTKTTQDKRIEPQRPLCRAFTEITLGKKFFPANAQGVEGHVLSRMAFFAAGKKDTSVKPGFRRFAPEMRPKQGYKFLCVYPVVMCNKNPILSKIGAPPSMAAPNWYCENDREYK
jgi:hypothetical protein